MDYEFSGQSYNGTDLIKQILRYKNDNDQVILVTSRSDEIIYEFCNENGISIISKSFSVKIPIKIVQEKF